MRADAIHDQRAKQKHQATLQVAHLALHAEHRILSCQLNQPYFAFLPPAPSLAPLDLDAG